MIRLQGFCFDGKTSQKIPVVMSVTSGHVQIHHQDDKTLLFQTSIEVVEISSRVGNTPRYCYFPDGQKLETLEHSQVDELVKLYKPSLFRTLAHTLESHLGFVFLTFIVVVTFTWAGVKYGLPVASKSIALELPQGVMNQAAKETLVFLDKFHFGESQLSPEVQQRILKHFDTAIQENNHLGINVLFRDGKAIGANAFALPDGTVVFTDQIVELSENDDELLAVLAHEIGHVEYRHSLRGVIQASALSFAISMLAGDVSAMGDLLVNFPIMLTTSAYSRNFEREADDHSLLFLDSHNIPRHSFIDLMDRLSKDHHCEYLIDLAELENSDNNKRNKKQADDKGHNQKNAQNESAEKSQTSEAEDLIQKETSSEKVMTKAQRAELCKKLLAEDAAKSAKDKGSSDLMDYFSSHPATQERLEKFRKQPVKNTTK